MEGMMGEVEDSEEIQKWCNRFADIQTAYSDASVREQGFVQVMLEKILQCTEDVRRVGVYTVRWDTATGLVDSFENFVCYGDFPCEAPTLTDEDTDALRVGKDADEHGCLIELSTQEYVYLYADSILFFFELDVNESKKDFVHGIMAFIGQQMTERNEILRFLAVQRRLKAEHSELRDRANFDELTRVLRPGLGMRRIKLAIEDVATGARNSIAVAFMDIDGLKPANDSFGHDAGNELLKVFVDIVVIQTGIPRDCVSRYGGDEFSAILRSEEDIFKVLDPLRDYEFSFATREEYTPGVSCGVITIRPEMARCMRRDGDIERLLKALDKAMYRVKKNGKHGVMRLRAELVQLEGTKARVVYYIGDKRIDV